ncbi:pirin family protein [Nitrogeniibacter aestuarii]|uniref:pirin family protein n=1 Tax=Nitrogeniibacter aestuarii TaxID=2815343 RepID=UPI001D104D92|nr:pirin family protein [Nitrogeniibacter aestuarii]
MTTRTLAQRIVSAPTSDGAGVRLRRSLGQHQGARLDPFLMLDEFSSDKADDYIAGFPSHPHRGFETVTYMLDGHMLHEDHMGNRGDLLPGGAQWMSAARGIIHSEMPQQESGRMRGFQLWINLPAAEKMKDAGYRDIRPEEIPEATLPGGAQVRVLAGRIETASGALEGPVTGVTTEPVYIDVSLPAGGRFEHAVPEGHSAFVYVFEGRAAIGTDTLDTHVAGVLTAGDRVEMAAHEGPVRFLLIAGRPIREPVVQYGPFVMNTREEIERALADYQSGRLTA